MLTVYVPDGDMQAVGLWVRLVKHNPVKVTPIRVLSKCTLNSLEDKTKDGTSAYRTRSAPNSQPQWDVAPKRLASVPPDTSRERQWPVPYTSLTIQLTVLARGARIAGARYTGRINFCWRCHSVGYLWALST